MNEAVFERRDAGFAVMLRRSMRPYTRGVGFHPDPAAAARAIAFGDALEGEHGKMLPNYATDLESRARAAASPSERQLLEGQFVHLRAEHVVSQLDFALASQEYARAAELTGDSQPIVAVDFRIRAHLFRGMGADTAAALEGLRALQVPDELQEPRLRAIGWLACIAGYVDESVSSFQSAARLAVQRADQLAASAAFRDAEWAEQRRGGFAWQDDPPGLIAFRLERATVRHNARQTVDALLERADRFLINGDARNALIAASAAQRLGYDEINPASVSRARVRLVRAWSAVAIENQTEDALFWALYYVGAARVEFEKRHGAALVEPLRSALQDPGRRALVERIVHALATKPLDAAERTGMLRVLQDLSELVDPELVHKYITSGIVGGLAMGWGGSRTDSAGAAIELTCSVADKFTPEDGRQSSKPWLLLVSDPRGPATETLSAR